MKCIQIVSIIELKNKNIIKKCTLKLFHLRFLEFDAHSVVGSLK